MSKNSPSRPETLSCEILETEDALSVTTRQGHGAGCFLLLWLTGWTAGCVMLIVKVFSDPQVGSFLFALPFWAAWLAVASFIMWLYFGREILLIKPDRVLFLRRCLITLTTREIPMSEVHSVRNCRSRHQENDLYLRGIEVRTLGSPIRFAFRLPANERQWLVHRLNGFVKRCQNQLNEGSSPAVASVARSRLSGALTIHDVLELPPSDGRWLAAEDVDSVEFRRRGRLSISAVLGLLFINAFWNGIVSVFVLALFGLMPGDDAPPAGGEWWAMAVFLIPFVVIGALMAVALLTALVEPFRETQWRFDQHEVVRRSIWPFVAVSKRWPVSSIAAMKLQRREMRNGRELTKSLDPDAESFQLFLVSADNIDQCGVSPLTEGDGRWMAGQIGQIHPDWLG